MSSRLEHIIDFLLKKTDYDDVYDRVAQDRTCASGDVPNLSPSTTFLNEIVKREEFKEYFASLIQ